MIESASIGYLFFASLALLCLGWTLLRIRAERRRARRFMPPKDWPRPFDYSQLQPPKKLPRPPAYKWPTEGAE